jgi:nucleoside-diphosphate-sugar epimerase
MDWVGKRILVTGGAGFIGSHLAERLLALGCDVSIADDFSRGSDANLSSFVNRITVHRVDLTQYPNCLRVTNDIDAIFHLASSVGGIHYLMKETVRGLTPNLQMTTNMLEAARHHDVGRFLFTSSACVYPERQIALNQFTEADAYPANPLTAYGWAKLMGERLCHAYYQDYGILSAVVRLFNTYGERENLDPRWSHVIPSLIRKAIRYPRKPFTIFGDGSQQRAFLYVQDCVDGLLLCLEHAATAEPINVGSNDVLSIRELAEQIIQLSGKTIPIQHDPLGPQGTRRYCADLTTMKRMLGWCPTISLAVGLQRTYAWTRRKLKLAC